MGIDSVFSMPGISTRYQVCRKEQSLYFYPRSTMKAALLLAAAAPLAAATPPVIPQTFTSQITTNTSGTAKSIPMGVKTYKQFYDYTNKRLRKDESSGMTKVYRYDKNIMPPISPGPNDPDFASPKGYQFQLSNPDLNCCWLWLVDTSNGKPFYPDRMFKTQIPNGAKDMGTSPKFGGTEHWEGSSTFPFTSTGDWYVKNNNEILQYNSFVNIPTQGTITTNLTYQNWTAGDIDISVFDHPASVQQKGRCKQFGVDPECSQEENLKVMRSMLEDATTRLPRVD